MNEISVSNQKEIDRSPFDNPMLLFLLIPIVKKLLSKNNGSFNLKINSLNNMSLTRILDKIDVLIKVAPYLPSDAIQIINKYLPLYDRMSKAFIVMEFFSRSSTVSPVVVANDLNPKEKTNRVSYILREELPKSEYEKIKPFVGIATNIDMYKGILKTITNLNRSDDGNDSNSMDNIINLIGPLLGQSNENMDKINEMMKMMDLINLFGEEDEEAEASTSSEKMDTSESDEIDENEDEESQRSKE